MNECNANTEYRISYAMNKIESNDHKISEIENSCKSEFQTIQNTISDFENANYNKFINVEKNIMNVKNELSMAISQVNTDTERVPVIMTRDVSSEVELELFSCDNRRVHPMQFLNRVREFNKFNTSSWEVQLLKILKCFKGSSEIWAEVHRTEWGNFEEFEAAFRDKY